MLCQFHVYSKVNYTYTYILFFFQILFPFRPLESIKWSSLCYTAGSYLFSYLFYSNVYTIISPSLTIYPAPHTAHILKHAEMKLQQIFLVRVSYSLSLGLTLGAYKRIVPGGRQLMRSFFRPLNNLKLSCNFLFPPFTT